MAGHALVVLNSYGCNPGKSNRGPALHAAEPRVNALASVTRVLRSPVEPVALHAATGASGGGDERQVGGV